ncbi:C45 family autoproteolytic acyltransferase/hydrolase [Desulfobotulus sp. H1]|uniref:C45 family autoproteolytic acyltransferase/hydrolase n=1 Tax=Desulfobotulus pelophilus TaxID=2823377 RepID=A0ABT3NBN1_9BACT|nr:C45 family peptidase [Desulfobotulus pelophilus]MCW7754869.1 C45 family autoproteolytic acyltransferase/hydrolase [Desulfobotulus pelophilus]
MKKMVLILLGGIMVVTGMMHAGAKAVVTGPVVTFEGGSLYRSGKVPVLDLHGSFHAMGRQYGYLLAEELQLLYGEAIENYFLKEKGLSAAVMDQTAEALYDLYPRRFKDILTGMAETSGLSLKQQIRLNALELYGVLTGCSGIFAWGEYAGNGPLIAGRNYDWFDSYAGFARKLAVTVWHPDSGIPTAMVTFAGVMYMTTGMNAEGLFLELNNGMPSGGGLTYTNRVPAIVSLMGFLMDYERIPQLDAAFHSTRPEFAFIITVADKEGAFAYEWAPFDLKRRGPDREGLLVATNHFADPAWGLALQPGTGFESPLRRENLLHLAEEHKGVMGLDTMAAVLDTPMDQGGATWPPEGNIRTVYQVIALPGERMFRIKVPGYQEWTDVDLKPFFQ